MQFPRIGKVQSFPVAHRLDPVGWSLLFVALKLERLVEASLRKHVERKSAYVFGVGFNRGLGGPITAHVMGQTKSLAPYNLVIFLIEVLWGIGRNSE